MSDQYRISTDTVRPAPTTRASGSVRESGGVRPGSGGVLRTLLWVLLVIGVLGNSVASFLAASLVVHLALGALTAVSVAALVLHHLAQRR